MENDQSVQNLKGAKGIVRIWRAMWYSLDGLKCAAKGEAAFRQELALAVILVPAALVLPLGLIWKAALISSVLIVLIVELLNTAVESVVDLVSPQYHPLAKRAKDMGSAAVFISLCNCGVFWALALVEWLR